MAHYDTTHPNFLLWPLTLGFKLDMPTFVPWLGRASRVLYNMYVYLYMHTMYMYMYLEVYHSLPSTFFLTSLLPACQSSELITHHPLPPSDELTSPVLSYITQEHYNPLRWSSLSTPVWQPSTKSWGGHLCWHLIYKNWLQLVLF